MKILQLNCEQRKLKIKDRLKFRFSGFFFSSADLAEQKGKASVSQVIYSFTKT